MVVVTLELLSLIKRHVSKFTKKKKEKRKTYGPNDGKPLFGPSYVDRDRHGLLYPHRYSRRVQQGMSTGWVYPTLAIPVPPARGWRVGGGSAHSNSAQKACQRSTQTTPDASFGPYVGIFFFLFLVFLPTTGAHKGPQRPMKGMFSYLFLIFFPTPQAHKRPTTANEGQCRSMKAHSSQHRPTQAHKSSQQPMTANKGQCRSTKAH